MLTYYKSVRNTLYPYENVYFQANCGMFLAKGVAPT